MTSRRPPVCMFPPGSMQPGWPSPDNTRWQIHHWQPGCPHRYWARVTVCCLPPPSSISLKRLHYGCWPEKPWLLLGYRVDIDSLVHDNRTSQNHWWNQLVRQLLGLNTFQYLLHIVVTSMKSHHTMPFFFFFELCMTPVVGNICICLVVYVSVSLCLEKASGWFLREDFCFGPSEMSGLQQILSELCPGSWSLLLVDGLWMHPTCAVSQIYYLFRHIFSQSNKCWVSLNRKMLLT